MIVLRKMEYQGLFIYVMQFLTTFQYIIAVDGDIYQDHVELKPSWKRKLLWWLGRLKTPYTADELDDGEQVILSGAMRTIDKLKSEGKLSRQGSKARTRTIRKVKDGIEARKGIKCSWYTTECEDGWYYECSVHKMKVKVVAGVKPMHD